MAKSHPARFFNDRPSEPWGLPTTVKLIFLAALFSLGLLLYCQKDNPLRTTVDAGVDALTIAQQAIAFPSPVLSPDATADADKYRAMGDYLGRRYRVSREMATHIVSQAYTAGRVLNLDPLLILAVISVESGFNPIAESGMGAKGLMQVIPRFHDEKFDSIGGEKTVFTPEANIEVGSQILKEYLVRTGNINDALQMYVGASSSESENGYAEKVLAERNRLLQVLHQYQENRQQIARS